jgi:hypothetical protein
LNTHQFTALIDDGQADELLMLLCGRGHDVFRHPYKSYALLISALRAARSAELGDDDLPDWCEWLWRQNRLDDDAATADLLMTWPTISS